MVTLHTPGPGLLSTVNVNACLYQGNHKCPQQEAELQASPPCSWDITEFLLASQTETWNEGLTQTSDPLPAAGHFTGAAWSG